MTDTSQEQTRQNHIYMDALGYKRPVEFYGFYNPQGVHILEPPQFHGMSPEAQKGRIELDRLIWKHPDCFRIYIETKKELERSGCPDSEYRYHLACTKACEYYLEQKKKLKEIENKQELEALSRKFKVPRMKKLLKRAGQHMENLLQRDTMDGDWKKTARILISDIEEELNK